MRKLTLICPDDWHLHLRDGEMLSSVAPLSAKTFGRAAVMPNLTPPLTTTEIALAYRQRILDNISPEKHFIPYTTLYLTETTPTEEIDKAKESGHILGAKLYPQGSTTHSQLGVASLDRIHPLLKKLEETAFPLLIHAEDPAPTIDIFLREQHYIEKTLIPLIDKFPHLSIVVEHLSSEAGVRFVLEHSKSLKIGATITPQHLALNRNDLFRGGLNPYHYCHPIVKEAHDQQALIQAATSGHPRFFLGTDSAPHPKKTKESRRAPAGIFSAPIALEVCAEVFAKANALDNLEKFTSQHGADFYGLPYNSETITLIEQDWQIPENYPCGENQVIPLRAGETLSWQIERQ